MIEILRSKRILFKIVYFLFSSWLPSLQRSHVKVVRPLMVGQWASLHASNRLHEIITSASAIHFTSQVLETVVVSSSGKAGGGEDEEEEEEATPTGENYSLHGSLGPKYGGDSELFYSQFDLHNRESKISQMVLLKVCGI